MLPTPQARTTTPTLTLTVTLILTLTLKPKLQKVNNPETKTAKGKSNPARQPQAQPPSHET